MTAIPRPYGEPPTLEMLRCESCKKLLAERITRPWQITCPRCGTTNRRRRGSPENPDPADGRGGD